MDEVVLTGEEMEALNLKDLLGLAQVDCAARIKISRTTFQRILIDARRKAAEILMEGKSLRVEGGAYDFVKRISPVPAAVTA